MSFCVQCIFSSGCTNICNNDWGSVHFTLPICLLLRYMLFCMMCHESDVVPIVIHTMHFTNRPYPIRFDELIYWVMTSIFQTIVLNNHHGRFFSEIIQASLLLLRRPWLVPSSSISAIAADRIFHAALFAVSSSFSPPLSRVSPPWHISAYSAVIIFFSLVFQHLTFFSRFAPVPLSSHDRTISVVFLQFSWTLAPLLLSL